VVAFRRATPSGRASGQAGPPLWHHHWVVTTQTVRQWYPSLKQHKIIYRDPYVKGDLDKPLLGGDVVRGLIR
jgi:hypothetical protein